MPQLKLRYTSRAQTDLFEIFDYLDVRDRQGAKRVIDAIECSAKILATHHRPDIKQILLTFA